MVKIFGPTDRLFSSNGDVVIRPLKAKVKKEDNGDFYLDLEAGLEYADYIVAGNIAAATTPQGVQAFRITDPVKTKTKISTRAYHVFYDSSNYLIRDQYVVDKDCNAALSQLNSGTDSTSPFTVLSDIGTVNTYRCIRKSLYEAIRAVIERWGGHLVRDNFSISIRGEIGQDNGVTVRYGKNIKEITCEEKWDDVCTKLLPVGKDGIMLNALNPTDDVYVYGRETYPIKYTKTITFNQDHITEDQFVTPDGEYYEPIYKQALVDDLRYQAQQYLEHNYLPKVNYTLKANVEKLTDIGDVVEVIDERLGVNVMTNVISYVYDCILEKYTELEFGNFKPTLTGLVSNINKSTEKIVEDKTGEVSFTLEKELKEATDKIWGALGNSYVIYDGDKILVVDKLPKETATNVIMINSAGIGFSSTGINGTFNSAWTIDGTMDMQKINVIHLTASMIKGGTLVLGGVSEEDSSSSGRLELRDEANNLIADMTSLGLRVHGSDGSFVLMNNDVGFAGYDMNGEKIYWAAQDEFRMKKAAIEDEIAFCDLLRFVPIQIEENGSIVNDGIGLIAAER